MSEGVQRGLHAGREHVRRVRHARKRDRALPRHPRRAAGVRPMSDYEHLIYEQRGPVTIITINRPERMNAIGPQTHRELVDAWDRFRADDDALVGVLTGAGDTGVLRRRRPEGGVRRRARRRRQPRRRRARPVAVDRHLQAHHRRRQRRRLRRRTRVGMLDRPGDRRRARHVRGDLPAVEHRAGRRRHATAHPHPRVSPRDRTDHHRAGHRRPRSRTHRPRQRSRARAERVCSGRSSWPRPSPRSPSPRCAPTSRRPAPGRADRSTTGCGSRRSASAGRSSRPRPSRVYADSTNAITLIDARTRHR